MKKIISLNSNILFKRVYGRGKNFANRILAIYILPNKTDGNRIGITVSKKVGKAVVRNHVKRLIKENYRLMECQIKKGNDIVFVARKSAAQADFLQIKSAMEHLLKHRGMFE